MQYKHSIAAAALASTALSAYVPSEPWNTLTPSGIYSDGVTDLPSSFGIAVIPITTSVSTVSAHAKRDVAPVTQIGDGQVQATTATAAPVAPVTQIGDGQIQATTATAAPVAPVSQIGDGQIQATTATAAPVAPVSQIGDGQIQATTSTVAPVTQIGDGQVQATTVLQPAATQIGDGQVHNNDPVSPPSNGPVRQASCNNEGTLVLNLKGSQLTDSKGRIGSIVANRQFQFDGPPPQAGAIYAAGWSVTPEGNLAIGTNDIFYQCLSGEFYNLYDESIGAQCSPVHLEAIDLISC